MNKHFIEFNVCSCCEHLKKEDCDLKCGLNGLIVATGTKYLKINLYISNDFSSLKKLGFEVGDDEKDSIVENIDEKCPRIIEHFVKCRDDDIISTFNEK